MTIYSRKIQITMNIPSSNNFHAWSKVKQWLWRSTLSRRTRALIVQRVVVNTILFDSNARPWNLGAVRRLEGMAEKCYRLVWSGGRGQSLKRMQELGVNMFAVRKELTITSIRTKPERSKGLGTF